MSPVVLTSPTFSVEEVAGLVLSDGQSDLNLLGTPPWGLYLVELTPPIVSRENTYVLKPEGQSRRRSRPLNAVGNVRVRIDRADSSTDFENDVDALEMMVESAHKRKGTLTFLPPNLRQVTYDIESCQITEAPADGPRMTRRIQEFVVEFECLPYGRLEPVVALEDEVLHGPIDGVEIPAVEGSVDAFGSLTVFDAGAVSSNFLEFAIGQQGYDADDPLDLGSASIATSGYTGTPTGPGGRIEAPLTTSVTSTCGTGVLRHNGRQKISATLRTSETDVWVRLAYKLAGGPESYGRWVNVPVTATDDVELVLATIDIGDANRWSGVIEAFRGSGTGTLLVEDIEFIPAEVCGRIRATGTDHALWQNKSSLFTHEGGFRDSLGGELYARATLYGDTLRVPASTASNLPSILVVRRRENDIDAGEISDGRGVDVSVTLTLTPRVALF